MHGANRRVISREYKLLLDANRFDKRQDGVKRFGDLLEFLVVKDSKARFTAQVEQLRRQTWYLDTLGFNLLRHGYVLRVREEQDEEQPYKLTLKYRHADRYLAAGQDVSSTEHVKKKDDKFEEDILPSFTSKFSRSASVRIDKLPDLADIGHAARLFPVLGKLEILPATPLVIANDFTAHEVVHWIGQFALDDDVHKPAHSDFVVKACLSFWYLIGESEDELPLVVEFSFDYEALEEEEDREDALEQFPRTLVKEANRLYSDLQDHPGWILARGTTKTAFALEAL